MTKYLYQVLFGGAAGAAFGALVAAVAGVTQDPEMRFVVIIAASVTGVIAIICVERFSKKSKEEKQYE